MHKVLYDEEKGKGSPRHVDDVSWALVKFFFFKIFFILLIIFFYKQTMRHDTYGAVTLPYNGGKGKKRGVGKVIAGNDK